MGVAMAKMVAARMIGTKLSKHIIGMKKRTELIWVNKADIEANEEVNAKALYLYWACFRGHIPLIRYIMDVEKISPFVRIHEGRSALMASLIGKHMNLNSTINVLPKEDQVFSDMITNRA